MVRRMVAERGGRLGRSNLDDHAPFFILIAHGRWSSASSSRRGTNDHDDGAAALCGRLAVLVVLRARLGAAARVRFLRLEQAARKCTSCGRSTVCSKYASSYYARHMVISYCTPWLSCISSTMITKNLFSAPLLKACLVLPLPSTTILACFEVDSRIYTEILLRSYCTTSSEYYCTTSKYWVLTR